VVTLIANFGSFTVIDHFAGHQIESVVARGQSRVLSVASIGGNAAGIIAGTVKNDLLDGRGGDDLLFGDRGRDHLLGGAGNDFLDGGKGADVLAGETGDDTLEGGKGPDAFVFAPGCGDDVILTFERSDKIDLTAFDRTFRNLDTDRDGRLEDGEGGSSGITVALDDGDTLLSFDGGSIRVSDAIGLQRHDFIL
jgi:Ca2+-binding RTX toxin-like protein